MAAAHISILGRHDPNWQPHAAIRESIIHAEAELGVVLSTKWLTPEELEHPEDVLAGTAAAILPQNDPKAPSDVIPELLDALSWLRRNRLPTLGIQSGMHHQLIEFARTELGRPDANANAWDDDTQAPVVTRLDRRWSEVEGTRPRFVTVDIAADTRLAAIYGQPGGHREAFRDQLVINPDFTSEFTARGVVFPAMIRRGDQQIHAAIEVPSLPYWLGVAYLPQVSSAPGRAHPLIKGLIEAARRT